MLALRRLFERVDPWGKSAGKSSILKLEFPSRHFLEPFPPEEFKAQRKCAFPFLYFSPLQSHPDRFFGKCYLYTVFLLHTSYRAWGVLLPQKSCSCSSASPMGGMGNSSGYSREKNQGNRWT